MAEGGRVTIDRDIALHILRTLRSCERVTIAGDTVDAIRNGRPMVEYTALTQEIMRAREWLEDQLVDVERSPEHTTPRASHHGSH